MERTMRTRDAEVILEGFSGPMSVSTRAHVATRVAGAASAALLAVLLQACNARPVAEQPAGATGCTTCHGGTDNSTGAPPRDIRGNSATTAITVGAHTSHLSAPHHVSGPVACETCHVVPSQFADPGHADGTGSKVTFGVQASGGTVTPAWNRADATCSVYCHGASLAGGSASRPVWTVVDGTQVACGGCHGAPPPRPHPQREDCRTCHPGTVKTDAPAHEIDLAGGLHLDRKVDVDYAAMGCTECHGDPNRPGASALERAAPPAGTLGEQDSTARAVGAHQAHLVAGRVAAPVACAECHPVPSSASHPNDTVDLVWGPLATADRATSSFDAANVTCSVYCHGATLGGGTNTTPVWTAGGSQSACGTCHGTPPPPPHSAATRCSACHPGTVNVDGSIKLAGKLHVNGVVDATRVHAVGWSAPTVHGYAANADLASCKGCHGADLAGGTVGISCNTCHSAGWQTTCTFCHGDVQRSANRAAPPVGTQGELSTSAPAVGAHQAHLADGAIRRAVVCSECHAVPADLSHVTGRPATLSFGALASADGAAPQLVAGTCAGTYCHGATLAAGGRITAPAWTTVDGSQSACGTCHGNPPPLPHVQISACKSCHGATMATDTVIDVAGGKHIDGTLQRTSYHPAGWAVPTEHGHAANRDLALCKTCHGADLAGGVALVSCSTCHTPGWQTNCTFCHGDPARPSNAAAPPLGTEGETATTARAVGAHQPHLSGARLGRPIACAECHAVPADMGHVNGTVAVSFGALATAPGANPTWDGASCSSTYCHGATLAGGASTAPVWTRVDGTQTGCTGCHGAPPAAPHPAVTGDLAGCSGCHPGTVGPSGAIVAASAGGQHVNGAVEFVRGHEAAWMNPSSPGFHAYAANAGLGQCQACHGPTLAGGASGKACARCHDGTQAAAWGSCTMCHGGTGNQTGAPPKATWDGALTRTDAAVRIGAHASHVAGTALAPAFDCGVCHVKPADVFSAQHLDGPTASVAFSGLAVQGATPAPWDRNSPTCTNTYCHGATLAGGTHKTPDWTRVDGTQAACGTCHGVPPSAPHPAVSGNLTGCSGCHPGTMDASGAMIRPSAGGEHLDGIVQRSRGHEPAWMDSASPGFHAYSANAGLGACQACHGPTLEGSGSLRGCDACHDGTQRPAWGSCTMCHGGTQNQTGAPPKATWGNGADPVRTGAHSAHVTGATLGAPIACGECHLTPADPFAPLHLDGSTATVIFGTLASNGVTPAPWARGTPTCSSTYCHGATLSGGSNKTPDWRVADGTQAACGTCHGVPPPAPHPAVSANPSGCSVCHPETVAGNGSIIPWSLGGKHLDGGVQIASGHGTGWMDPAAPGFHAYSANGGLASCQACHGQDLQGGIAITSCSQCHGATWMTRCTMCHGGTQDSTGAPPKATWGNRTPSDTTNVRIGAHAAHVVTAKLSAPFACDVCHVKPADALAPGHVDASTADVRFAGVAGQGTWNRTTATCSNTYCHGATLPGGSLKTPKWTKVDGTQDACGTCHESLPQSGEHLPHIFTLNIDCYSCHPGTGSWPVSVNPTTHVNGVKEVRAYDGTPVNGWDCETCHDHRGPGY
jgi:predicted CxxxxCH...CXXCH cytochrome family protein